MSDKKKYIISFMLILFFSVIYMLPSIITKNIYHFTNQDTAFHLSRIRGLSNVLSSPVNFNNFGGNGTAMNIFYPWLTLYPAYMLLQITGNLIVTYNLYYLFFTFITMSFSYLCMYKIQKSHFSAIVFSLIYGFASYRSTDIYFRGSLGEAIALTFLPLIFLGCYYIFFSDYKKWYWLTIGMTLTVYTHLLSVLLNVLIIFIVFLFSIYLKSNKKERIFALTKATICTLSLSAAAFVPMFQQSSFVKLKVPRGGTLRGLNVSEYFSATLNNNLSYFGVGLLIFFVALHTYKRREKLTKFNLFIFFMGLFTLYISTSLFPWFIIQKTPLTVIQFTWRLTAYATLFLSYAGSVSLTSSTETRSKKINKFLSLSVFIIILHVVSVQHLISQDGKDIYNSNEANLISQNYVHTDYANKASLNYSEMLRNKEFIIDNVTQNVDFSVTDSTFSFSYDNTSNKPINVVTPLYFYKGQVVQQNGEEISSSLSKYGTTQFSLDAGKSTIKIFYKYTKLARFAQIISLLSLILFIFYLLKKGSFQKQ